MESYEGSLIAATLANRAGKGTDAALIADAIVSTWQLIDTALSPIIGHGGVAALYKRSLYLTGRVHPWLAGAHEGIQPGMDLAGLKSVLAQQSSANAAAGGGAFLQTFRELLVGLVGPALTEQLLHSVWENFSAPPRTIGHHDN
jgi:hypothetical protein